MTINDKKYRIPIEMDKEYAAQVGIDPSEITTIMLEGKRTAVYFVEIEDEHLYYELMRPIWNRKHCELTMHNGVDIIQNSGSPVYAMFDGEITDAKDGHLTLTTNGNKANLWYDDEHHLKVTYSNVSPIVNNNDNVKAGDIIGYSTRERRCYTMNNASTGCDYVHISLSVEYASGLLSLSTEWKTVDPRLLIGLDNN